MFRTARLLRRPSLHLPTPPLRLTSSAFPRPSPGGLSPSSDRLLPIRFVPLARGVVRYSTSGGRAMGEVGAAGTASAPDENPTMENQHTTSGAAAEIRGVASDLAGMISGKSAVPAMGAREMSSSWSTHGSVSDDFWSVTRMIIREVPRPALVVGLAGTLPYLGTSLATVFLAREAAIASTGERTFTGFDLHTTMDMLNTVEHVQITYGAIIISFLGAIHWGFEFARYGGAQGYRRLALGVIPVLFAWPTTFAVHSTALIAQWLGFTGLWLLDQRASTQAWTPAWYSTYRFYLSIIVGLSIIGTFVGTGYYGAGAGALHDLKTAHHLHDVERASSIDRLDRVREKNFPKSDSVKTGKNKGETKSPIIVEESNEAYGRLRNLDKEKEEEEGDDDEEEDAADGDEGDDGEEEDGDKDEEDKDKGDDGDDKQGETVDSQHPDFAVSKDGKSGKDPNPEEKLKGQKEKKGINTEIAKRDNPAADNRGAKMMVKQGPKDSIGQKAGDSK